MKYTGVHSGLVGGIIKFLLVLILGVILALGGQALFAYTLLTKEGSMGTVSDLANSAGVGMELTDEIKDMNLLEWGKEVMGIFGNLTQSNIGDIESLLGINTISETINELSGIEIETLKMSSIGDLGKTLTSEMSLNMAVEKFGISLPSDIPLFAEGSEFLDEPLATAFQNITDYTVGDLIVLDENSHTVLRQLSSLSLNELGGDATTDIISSTFIGELMTIDENSTEILQSIKWACVESQYEVDENGEFILDTDGEKIYKTKTVIVDGVEEVKPLKGINETIAEDITVGSVVAMDENTNAVLKQLENVLINDLGGEATNDIIMGTFIGELMEIDDTSTAILQSIEYATLSSQYEVDAEGNFVLDTDGNKVYKTRTVNIDGVDVEKPLKGINEFIAEDITVGEVITMDDNTNAVLKRLENVLIDDLGGEGANEIITGTFIGELITIDDTSPEVLRALQWATLESHYKVDENGDFILNGTEKVYKTRNVEVSPGVFEDKEMIGISEKLDVITLGETMDLTGDDTNAILKKLSDSTLNSLPNDIQGAIDTTKLSEIMTIDDTSPKILFSLKDTTVSDLGSTINTITLENMMTIDDSSNAVLKKLKDSTLDSLPTDVTTAVNTSTLGEIITVDDSSPDILKAIKDTQIENLGTAINELKLSDLFGTPTDGVLMLIPSDTELADMDTALQSAIIDTNIAVLEGIGVVEPLTFGSMGVAQKSFIYNNTITGMLNGTLAFIADPVDTTNLLAPVVNYSVISPNEITLGSATYSSLTEFMTEYNQYDTIKLTQDVTVTIDLIIDSNLYESNGMYFTKLFSIVNNGHSLTFSDGVCLAKLEADNITLSKNQHAYCYSVSTGNSYQAPNFTYYSPEIKTNV